MEEYNKLIGGINRDSHPSAQKKNTARELKNWVVLSQEGNLFSLQNEDGTVLQEDPSNLIPTGFQVIGHTVLNTDIILILSKEVTPGTTYYSQVGIWDPINSSYTAIAPTGAGVDTNGELGFRTTHPVDCVARKLINGHRVLYYTDNLNPFGRIDLDDPPVIGSVADDVSLVFKQKLPNIDLTRIQEGVSGSLRPTVYQFVTRYVTENGGTTTCGIPSNMIPITPEPKTVGVDKYHGEFYEYGDVNKNIILEISNVDTQFKELEIIVSYFINGGTRVNQIAGRVSINNSDTISFTYSGPNAETLPISTEEIQELPISYTRAKCIEQKDNFLFLSNLTADAALDNQLQGVANNITVEYEIEEIPYSGRDGNGLAAQDKSSGLLDKPTLLIDSSGKDLSLLSPTGFEWETQTGPGQQPISATLSSSYEVLQPAIPTIATITVDDHNFLDAVVLEITNGAGETNDYTQGTSWFAGTSNEVTAASIVTSINDGASAAPFPYYAVIDSVNANQVNVISWRKAEDQTDPDRFLVSTYDGNAIGVTGTDITGLSTTSFSGGQATIRNLTPTTINIGRSVISIDGFGEYLTPNDELTVFDRLEYFPAGNVQVINFPITSATNEETSTIAGGAGAFTDYIDEKVCFDKRTYRRGEVYSLGYMLVYDNGSVSNVYHIPGNDRVTTNTTDANTVTKELGTYISESIYPTGQEYPTEGGGVIRHHKMPTLAQESHYDSTGANIRLINLKFTLGTDLPAAVAGRVREIVFVRERRNSTLNRSMYAQGVVNRLVETSDHFTNDGRTSGSGNPLSSFCLTEMPFFNNLTSINGLFEVENDDRFEDKERRAIVYPGVDTANGFFASGVGDLFTNGAIKADQVFFHSPETLLLTDTGLNPNIIKQGKLVADLELNGSFYCTQVDGHEWQGRAGEDWLAKYGLADVFCDYSAFTSVTPSSITIKDAQSLPAGKRRNKGLDDTANVIKEVSTRWTQGGYHLLLDSGVTVPAGDEFKITHRVRLWGKRDVCGSNCQNERIETSCIETGGAALNNNSTGTNIKNYLYNITITNPNQYGAIDQGDFIPIAKRAYDTLTYNTPHTDVYGGDTFITKFAFNTSNVITYYPPVKNNNTITKPHKTVNRRDYFHIEDGPETGNGNIPTKAEGYDFRATHYYFVESEINTYYRHKPEDPEQEELQDYFPNDPNPLTQLGNFFGYLGNINAYNGFYSYENNLRVFTTRSSTAQDITDFHNRTIYSTRAASDDTLDAYRDFAVNDYYDLPSHTGPIWDSFVYLGSLYLHTPKSLWRTFAEPAATLSGGNTEEDIVLGTGSLFARPSVPTMTTSGGYGGTISQFAGTPTLFGYVFPDVLQGKIFMIASGEKSPFLKEISNEGLSTFFHQNLGKGIDFSLINNDDAHLIDNPFTGIGIMSGYDYKLKRVWIVKKNPDPDPEIEKQQEFCYSYNVASKGWFEHSYRPNAIISYDNRTFFGKNGTELDIWEMNVGAKGSFFGSDYESEIQIVLAAPENVHKVIDNMVWGTNSINTAGVTQVNDTFKTFQCYTTTQNTGLLTVAPLIATNAYASKDASKLFFRKNKAEHTIAIPRDYVVDATLDVQDLTNLYAPIGSVAIANNYRRPRMKGEYFFLDFTYDNTPDNEFIVKYLKTIFRANFE